MLRCGLVALLVISSACAPELPVAPSPSHSGPPIAAASATPVPALSATPTAPRSAAAPVDPSRFATVPAAGYEGFALGPLSGEVVFVLVSLALVGEASVQLWAIPASGEPKLAARFRGAARDIGRQFSPDGKRIVLSVATPRLGGGQRGSLVILELDTGKTVQLGRDDGDSDLEPAWSPVGRDIAYIRRPDQSRAAFDDGIWLIRDDGTDVRQIVAARAGASTELHGWTGNGSHIGFSHSDTRNYTLVDPASKAELRVGSGYVAPVERLSFAWRGRAPRFAGIFVEQTGCVPRYIGVSDARGDFSLVLREGNVACAASLRNVRWHPTDDSLMYLTDGPGTQVREVSLAGAERTIPVARRPTLAEWSARGEQVIYAGLPGGECCNPDEVRLVNRDGTAERVIFASTSRIGIYGLAVRVY